MTITSSERTRRFEEMKKDVPVLEDIEEISFLITRIFSLFQTDEVIEKSFEKLEEVTKKYRS